MALGARGSLSIGGDSNPRGGVGLPSVGGGGAQRRRERLLARRSLGLGSNEVSSARAAHSACLALVQAALASGWSGVWSSGDAPAFSRRQEISGVREEVTAGSAYLELLSIIP